ncbi:MAG: baseplate J/gp47 family protein [Patescibacteria group bacterium]|nr:baseplate J/gp47 family protein [Patescibacteria group bacterium]
MSGFSPFTLTQLQAAASTGYASQAGTPANTDPGSSLGAIFNAAAMLTLFEQNEAFYIQAILRLASIPPLPNGAPNPDVDSFCEAFGVPRLGPDAASGTFTFTTYSPVGSTVTVPAGAIYASPTGVQFQVQAGGPNYDSTTGGYDITAGNSSVDVPGLCLQEGIIGNVVAGTQFAPVGGQTSPIPPAIATISNASDLVDGLDTEPDSAYKARFTITVASGRTGTGLAIVAAALAVQSNIIYSYGDQVNPDGSAHPGFFTLYVNLANSGTVAPPALVTACAAAVEAVRSAGISYAVLGPAIQPITVSASLTIKGNFSAASVIAAANAQWALFANATGLQPDTSLSRISIAAAYASLLRDTNLNGVPCVADVQNLTLNGGTSDITAAFGTQLVAGTPSFTAM